jgi:asparagine synthase (glutamine-hydrolysing)
MSFTLEGRVPLLDINVVKEAFKLPASAQVMPGITKKLFREISEPYIGKDLAYRTKQGFGGPVPFWVEKKYKIIIDVVINAKMFSGFDKSGLDYYYLKGKKNKLSDFDSFELFQLYCLARWYERFNS